MNDWLNTTNDGLPVPYCEKQTMLYFTELDNFTMQIDSFDAATLYEVLDVFLQKEVRHLANLSAEKRLLLLASMRKISKLHSKLHTKMKSSKPTNLALDLIEAIALHYILANCEHIVLTQLHEDLDIYLQNFQ